MNESDGDFAVRALGKIKDGLGVLLDSVSSEKHSAEAAVIRMNGLVRDCEAMAKNITESIESRTRLIGSPTSACDAARRSSGCNESDR